MIESSVNIEQIYDYYRSLDRSIFIEDEHKDFADYDTPLPIGFGQTISQPSLVLEMTIQLDLDKDSRVLEIGTGSGYQTAFLAEFAKEVYSIERIEELQNKAKQRLNSLGYKNIHFKLDDGSEGWPEFGPFDRIIAAASAAEVPKELLNQLAPGGKMIIPVGKKGLQELKLISKDERGEISPESLGQVRFVEFKGKYGWH